MSWVLGSTCCTDYPHITTSAGTSAVTTSSIAAFDSPSRCVAEKSALSAAASGDPPAYPGDAVTISASPLEYYYTLLTNWPYPPAYPPVLPEYPPVPMAYLPVPEKNLCRRWKISVNRSHIDYIRPNVSADPLTYRDWYLIYQDGPITYRHFR
jgi:hypothetical protein